MRCNYECMQGYYSCDGGKGLETLVKLTTYERREAPLTIGRTQNAVLCGKICIPPMFIFWATRCDLWRLFCTYRHMYSNLLLTYFSKADKLIDLGTYIAIDWYLANTENNA